MADYVNRQNVRLVLLDPRRFLVHSRAAINPIILFSLHPFGALNPCFLPRRHVLVPHGSTFCPPVSNSSVLIRMEEESSTALCQLMINEGLLPPPEEEEKRGAVIEKLKQIVMKWVKKVAWLRRLPQQQIAATKAAIITYGSYGLGVHGSESDLDALCVGPFFASMAEDFFIILRDMLKSRPEVSEIHCVKDAKVPLMRFKFDGIPVDLPYAQLKLVSIPDNVDVLNLSLLRNIDEISWKSLSGVRANKRILQLVPDLEKFQSLLRCLKLWAKRRGIYVERVPGRSTFGYSRRFVCQSCPKATLSALMAIFFRTFAFWQWPISVGLNDGISPNTAIPAETRGFMPIRLPCSANEYCHSNVTQSTFYKIRKEFLRGHNMTRDYFKPEFNWQNLFEPFPYSKKYTRFVEIYLSASRQEELVEWVGWVKSRFRCLLVKLEELYGLCDPNPTEYIDTEATRPNIVLYWGLHSGKACASDIESVEVDFLKNISNGYQGHTGKMQLSVVEASQLPKNGGFENKTGAFWRNGEDKHQGTPAFSQYLPELHGRICDSYKAKHLAAK